MSTLAGGKEALFRPWRVGRRLLFDLGGRAKGSFGVLGFWDVFGTFLLFFAFSKHNQASASLPAQAGGHFGAFSVYFAKNEPVCSSVGCFCLLGVFSTVSSRGFGVCCKLLGVSEVLGRCCCVCSLFSSTNKQAQASLHKQAQASKHKQGQAQASKRKQASASKDIPCVERCRGACCQAGQKTLQKLLWTQRRSGLSLNYITCI